MWRRGADSDGYVANFVESEQIIQLNGYTASFVQVYTLFHMCYYAIGHYYSPLPFIAPMIKQSKYSKRHF